MSGHEGKGYQPQASQQAEGQNPPTGGTLIKPPCPDSDFAKDADIFRGFLTPEEEAEIEILARYSPYSVKDVDYIYRRVGRSANMTRLILEGASFCNISVESAVDAVRRMARWAQQQDSGILNWLCWKILTYRCKCLYESDCHGIEMIKSPSGKEWAIGGTNTVDRWKFCPWCGGRI